MKKPSRFLALLGAFALLSTMLVAAIGPAAPAAGGEVQLPIPFDPEFVFNFDDPDFEPLDSVVYYPWVGNDDESTGLGPADTSITVQNLSLQGAQIYIFVGSGDGGWDYVTSAALAAWASKTFTADALGIEAGSGAPVAVAGAGRFITFEEGTNQELIDLFGEGLFEVREEPVLLSKPVGVLGDDTQVTVCIAQAGFATTEGGDTYNEAAPFAAAIDIAAAVAPDGVDHPAYEEGDIVGYPADDSYVVWETQAELQALLNAVNPGPGGQLVDPFGGLNADGDCNDVIEVVAGEDVEFFDPVPIGGVAKQAVDGETLPYTTAADTVVSGYNAVNQAEVASFGEWYQPIVQTNCGPGGCWNTILRVANLGNLNNAVTVSFFPADDGSVSLATGFQLQSLIDGGDVWHIDLGDYVPEGWVGSAHVRSDGAVFTMADRVKVGYNMWITNTGSSANFELYDAGYVDDLCQCAPGGGYNYVLFAPDVRLDFFGWNTGINVANLAGVDNNVSIQYFNHFGNATEVLNQRLAAQGMTYLYDPSQAPQDNSQQDPTQDVNADIVGSALIWSQYPVAVAVDATKYPESTTEADANLFQASSYSATRSLYPLQFVPLVQKGNPASGLGATSGINIMNPGAVTTSVTVYWVNPSGVGASNFGTSHVTIPANANGFVYSMTQHNLPNGFVGSAVAVASNPIVATSAQVDYQVQWDGTAIWNAFNPCGFFRAIGDCAYGDPFAPVADGSTIEKTYVDETGAPVSGVQTILYDADAFGAIGVENPLFAGETWTGVSDEDGEVSFNVPAGTYYLIVTDVLGSDGYDLYYQSVDDLEIIEVDGVRYEVITVGENEFVGVTNELERILPIKHVNLAAAAAGMEICLHADDDGDGVLDPEEVTSPEYCLQADADGDATFVVEPGWYFVSTNLGAEFDVLAGYNSPAFVSAAPEFFALGGEYWNDLQDDVVALEGSIQKVLTLPDFLHEAFLAGDASIDGIIQIFGPGGFETEGNVQTFFDDNIGPNNEPSFSITDFNVPVGGPYEIEEFIQVHWDDDGNPATPDVTFTLSNTITLTDDQVICDDFLQASTTCAASPDAPAIYVYEDQVTRVFNDLAAAVVGQLDVFVRDEVTDLPLEGAEVCLFDEDLALVAPCELTNAAGIASFAGVPNGNYTVNASHVDYEGQATTTIYDVLVDAGIGPGLADSTEATADVVIALDPKGAVLDATVVVNGNVAPNQTVALAPASLLDGPGSGPFGTAFCANPPTQLGVTDALGEVDFNVQGGVDYCLVVNVGGILGDSAANSPVSVPAGDPAGDEDTVLTIVSGNAVIDVQVIAALGLGDIQTGIHPVVVYVEVGGEVYGNNGSCVGPPIAVGTTTSTGVGEGVFSATIDTTVTGNNYCVEAESADGLGGGDPTVAPVIVLAGDPIGDIDVTINTT
ncbi:hypothetical protein BH23CHL2_BH23CHL2_20440 [soil metagenome]